MAFATVADLEARMGRELTSDEEAQASVLLDDAAAMLTALIGFIDPDDAIQAQNLKQVSCSMVKRSMMSGTSGAFGVDEATATMGPFSQRVQYANPAGDLYVSKAERAILGIGKAMVGGIRAKVRPLVVYPNADC